MLTREHISGGAPSRRTPHAWRCADAVVMKLGLGAQGRLEAWRRHRGSAGPFLHAAPSSRRRRSLIGEGAVSRRHLASAIKRPDSGSWARGRASSGIRHQATRPWHLGKGIIWHPPSSGRRGHRRRDAAESGGRESPNLACSVRKHPAGGPRRRRAGAIGATLPPKQCGRTKILLPRGAQCCVRKECAQNASASVLGRPEAAVACILSTLVSQNTGGTPVYTSQLTHFLCGKPDLEGGAPPGFMRQDSGRP